MTALKRLLGEGFRVFFLAAGLWGVLAMALWAVSLGAGWSLPGTMVPQYWHAHEMIFGYGGAALGGFFLTAVPNWTGAAAARHLFIGTVAGLWLAGRLAVALSGVLPPALVALVCLSFLPVLGAKIATQLIRRPKPQNLLFLVLLALVWLGEWRVQLDLLGLPWGDSAAGLRAGLYGLGAMIAVLGGRVTPAFTRNALIRQTLADTGTEPAPAALPHTRKPFDPLAISLSIAVVVAVLAGLPDALSAVLMLAFALAQLLRMRHWRSDFALRQPILWALHLSFLGLALGYAMTGLALFGIGPEIGHRRDDPGGDEPCDPWPYRAAADRAARGGLGLCAAAGGHGAALDRGGGARSVSACGAGQCAGVVRGLRALCRGAVAGLLAAPFAAHRGGAMNRRRFLCIAAAAAATPVLAETGAPLTQVWQGTAMGSAARITLSGVEGPRAQRIFTQIARELDRIESLFSLHRDSALTRTTELAGRGHAGGLRAVRPGASRDGRRLRSDDPATVAGAGPGPRPAARPRLAGLVRHPRGAR